MSAVIPKKPVNILDLTPEEKLKFLNSFDRVFSDIDGVAWNFHEYIEGASDGFNLLQNAGKKVVFVTNNSVRSVDSTLKQFKSLNMNIHEEHIIHPAQSIIAYLKSIQFEGLIYIIATDMVKNQLREAGYKLIDGPTKILDESYTDLAKHVIDREPVRAVVIDADFNLSAPKLIRAQIYLRKPDTLLIIGATDMLLPVQKDFNIIGPGPFSKVVAEASKKKMIVLGKPGKELSDLLIERFDIKDKKRVLMVGDMLEQDVQFGKQSGFQTLVVFSGGCTPAELDAETNLDSIPDYYANSMADFVDFFNDIKQNKL